MDLHSLTLEVEDEENEESGWGWAIAQVEGIATLIKTRLGKVEQTTVEIPFGLVW